MNGFNTRSNRAAFMAVVLILATLARAPFAGGLVLHDHSDHGLHSHTVALDDLRDGELCTDWHHHHDGNHDHDSDDRKNDSDGDACADSLLVFVSIPANAVHSHFSSGAVFASILRSSSHASPRSMLPRDSTAIAKLSGDPWRSAHLLRPVCALDALLQSSHALLL
jgi:hypothetical protein